MSTSSARSSAQPGKYLSVDSRPGTAKENGKGLTVAVSPSVFFAPFDSHHFLRSKNVENRYRYVTSPFKQGRQRNVYNTEMFPEPDAQLKEQTLSTIHLCKVNLQSEEARLTPNHKRQSALQSRRKPGRLQPLLGKPIVRGPTIQQCMGITSGPRSKSRLHKIQSPLLSRGNTALSFASFRSRKDREELLRPESSVHRNSYSSMRFATDDSSSDEDEEIEEAYRNLNSSRSKLQSRVKFHGYSSDDDKESEIIDQLSESGNNIKNSTGYSRKMYSW